MAPACPACGDGTVPWVCACDHSICQSSSHHIHTSEIADIVVCGCKISHTKEELTFIFCTSELTIRGHYVKLIWFVCGWKSNSPHIGLYQRFQLISMAMSHWDQNRRLASYGNRYKLDINIHGDCNWVLHENQDTSKLISSPMSQAFHVVSWLHTISKMGKPKTSLATKKMWSKENSVHSQGQAHIGHCSS